MCVCVCVCINCCSFIASHTANGEILGLSLLMEDVLTSGETERALYAASDEDDEPDEEEDAADSRSIVSNSNKVKTLSRPSSVTQLSGEFWARHGLTISVNSILM